MPTSRTWICLFGMQRITLGIKWVEIELDSGLSRGVTSEREHGQWIVALFQRWRPVDQSFSSELREVTYRLPVTKRTSVSIFIVHDADYQSKKHLWDCAKYEGDYAGLGLFCVPNIYIGLNPSIYSTLSGLYLVT